MTKLKETESIKKWKMSSQTGIINIIKTATKLKAMYRLNEIKKGSFTEILKIYLK